MDLSQVLRKARVLASELRSEELQEWTEAEQNGYMNKDTLPDYRVSSASNFGNFVGSFGQQGKSMPIPLSCLPERWRERAKWLELRQGVAALQEMYWSDTDYKWQWPADTIAAVSQDIYHSMNMVSAWTVIPKTRVADVIDAVRNRLLSFLLDLREQHPEVEIAGGDLRSIPKEDVRVNVVNNIYGSQNVVATGGTVHQQAHQGVQAGDLISLISSLRELLIPEDLITELSSAIKEDEPVRKDGIGPKVSRWLAGIGENVATASAVSFVTQAILRYYELAGA